MKQYKANDVKNKIETKLHADFNTTKENNGWIYKNNKKFTRVTIPKGNKELAKGTLDSIVKKQLKLKKEDFETFMACHFGYDKYIELTS